MAQKKNIKYLNKDFSSFRDALVDYAKTYFNTSYNDFSATTPGMMFMEMASYVGDVLSFYQDNQFQEVFTQYATGKDSLYTLAYMLGYKPKVTSVSTTKLDIYHQLPAITSGSVVAPDYRYALVLAPGTQVKSTFNDTVFYVKDKVDFSVSSSYDNTTLTVYSINGGTNLPNNYLIKKSVDAISATPATATFTVGTSERFYKIILSDTDIIEITSITDSDGNIWYEVPYLAQETIFQEISNNITNDPNFSQYSSTAPYLLKLLKVQRRFVTRFRADGTCEISFGAGTTNDVDEIIIPNQDNVGIGLVNGLSKITTAFDPSNFLYTKTYGIAPSNTTLTVNYLVGGGASANVPSNTITSITNVNSSFRYSGLDNVVSSQVVNSLLITNPTASVGGGDGDSIEELRLNTLASFPAQLRTVTLDDYLIRAYSLPARFGIISKAYVVQDSQITDYTSTDYNPLAISMYILSQGDNGNLTTCNAAIKQNLKTYLSQYRMLTDGINIKNAFIINIGVNFDILILPDFNSQQVILDCVVALQDYFDIKKWQINQPIVLSEIYTLLDRINGVQTVKNVEIVNKNGTGYSQYGYDITAATNNRVIYPSLDPSIFEVKYPNIDISGRTSNF